MNVIRNEKAIKRKIQSTAQREKYMKKKAVIEKGKEESDKRRSKEHHKSEGQRQARESAGNSRAKKQKSE